jgi:hypothetical protein
MDRISSQDSLAFPARVQSPGLAKKWVFHPMVRMDPELYPEAMKNTLPRLLLFALPLTASLFLASCVSEYSAHPHLDAHGTYTTYATLPSGYAGDAYYYNNRYYAGGRYEPGTYSYRGQTYDHRYFHNGQYFYGGDYRRSSAGIGTGSVNYVTYRELPRDYSGDAYYYNNRYYAGGRYEPGTYSYRGQTYTQRYFHDGQYLYGGEYRRPSSGPSPAPAPVYRTTRW